MRYRAGAVQADRRIPLHTHPKVGFHQGASRFLPAEGPCAELTTNAEPQPYSLPGASKPPTGSARVSHMGPQTSVPPHTVDDVVLGGIDEMAQRHDHTGSAAGISASPRGRQPAVTVECDRTRGPRHRALANPLDQRRTGGRVYASRPGAPILSCPDERPRARTGRRLRGRPSHIRRGAPTRGGWSHDQGVVARPGGTRCVPRQGASALLDDRRRNASPSAYGSVGGCTLGRARSSA